MLLVSQADIEGKGWAVHDAFASYFGYHNCRHALCNAHLLRELSAVHESHDYSGQLWPQQMINLLCHIKETVGTTRARGATRLSRARRDALRARYAALLADGLKANPPPVPSAPSGRKQKHGRLKQSAAKNLLDRLATHQACVLAFMDDFSVPFDNN